MSILNRLTAGHLDDAALAEIWTAQAAGSSEVIADDHLAQCAECRVRFAAFAAWMEDVRTDAVSEADAAFPAERLATQQAQILRRLESAERPARVIAFPKYPVGAVGQPSLLRRWVAMSAAASFIIGIGIGSLMDLRHFGVRGSDVAVTTPAPQGGVTPASDTQPADDDGVDDLAAPAAAPGYGPLKAFDTITPRAADFLSSSR